MRKTLLILGASIALVSCGPSAEEQKAHEEERQAQEEQLDEAWEDDLMEMLDDSI